MKIKAMVDVFNTVKNWHIYALDYIKVLKQPYIIHLKNGIRIWMRPNSLDRIVINDIWIYKTYTKEFDIGKDDIVVDVGANIGIFSIFAAMFTKNKIYSFEPVPESFGLMKSNIILNKVSNIIPINKAMSGKTGKREFFVSKDKPAGSSFYPKDQPDWMFEKQEKMVVDGISLKDFVKEYDIPQIDFLKIDCEGCEYEMLFNCPINILKRIKRMSIEYHPHPYYKPVEGIEKRDKLRGFLEKNGFKTKTVDTYIYAQKTWNNMNPFDKWKTCKYATDSIHCSKLDHDVGVNGASIQFHCTNCLHYKHD